MSNLPANITNLVNDIQKTKQSIQSAGHGNIPFLRLLTDGEWVYGQDDIPVADDDLWVANPMSFEKGFISWGDKNDPGLKGEEMASISDSPIVKSNLEETGHPWKQQLSVQLVCIEGKHQGDAVLYKTSSFGGIKVLDGLLTSLLAQIAETNKAGTDDVVPVIELQTDSYKHKQHGKTYTPVLEITEWASLSEGIHEAPEDDEPEPEPETEPKRKRARKAATKKNPEPEVVDDAPEDAEDVTPDEDEKPTRRRRRVRS